MKQKLFIFLAILIVSATNSTAVYAANDTAWEFVIRDFKIRLTEQRFNPEKHKIEMCKENPKLICKIDGSFPYGYGFEMPYSELTSFRIEYNKQAYTLDTSHMYNAWHSSKKTSGMNRDIDISCRLDNICIVRGLFAGEVATYMAVWELNTENRTSRRIKISSDENDIFPLYDEFSK